ncbi:MAG: adaptor protein MecA [Clostridia bacterium]|nr:adaptor protein MecA [Clostridia bacterium]
MKIEKLTENKIRVILSLEDLEKNDLTFEDFASNAINFQSFFVHMLDKAERELGFITKDCKLLIESFSSSEEILVFTITKFAKDSCISNNKKKTVKVKRKQMDFSNSNLVYKFNTFDEFCYFCESIDSTNLIDKKIKIAQNISLYLYNSTYYLVFTNINKDNQNNKTFFYYLSEFASLASASNNFNSKLLEHGELIMKNNAIITGINFFAKNKF